ncbi:MAG: hypothetical protein ACJAS4_002479 [Bacteriovoracaceae bacterium]|jgi:hypothetical protein
MKKILLTILTILVSTSSFSEEVSEKELNTFLEAIKEKKDEELLISSPDFEKCQTDLENFRKQTDGGEGGENYKKKLGECVKETILGEDGVEGSNEKLLKIADNLGLESYNKGASSSSTSIRDYLSKRIYKAIHGVDRDKKDLTQFKDRKIVNHDIYYQLYAEQVGKNTLLEVSKYCLENFGLKDKKQDFLYLVPIGSPEKTDPKPNFAYSINSYIKNSDDFENLLQDAKKLNPKSDKKWVEYSKRFQIDDNEINNTISKVSGGELPDKPIKDLWLKQGSLVEEYQACTGKTENDCDYLFPKDKATPYRSIYTNSLLKDIEFKLSAKDSEKELIKARYGFCASSVIQNMCEIYKCNNVYDTFDDKIVKNCKDTFSIIVKNEKKLFSTDDPNSKVKEIELKSKNIKGAVACNLMRRLKEYRVVLKTIKEIKKDNQKFISKTGINNEGNEVFNGSKGTIDKLTSISSTELVENVDSLKNAEENAAKLREECLVNENGGNELDGFKFKPDAMEKEVCAPLVAKMDSAKFEVITLDTEAKTALRLKQIEDLSDEEQLKKYLEENNLEEYIGQMGKLSIDEIKNLISADFKAQRMALVDSLKERFKKEKEIQIGSQKDDAENIMKGLQNDVANQTIADIEQHKKRVETLFEYSNIVSSYLEVNDEDGNKIGSNEAGRNIEFEKNENVKNDYFSNDESSGGSGGSLDYLQALGQIVGIPEEEKE